MADQLIVPSTELALVDGVFAEACERAQRRVLEPNSENTQRAYRRHWRDWRNAAERYAYAPLPIQPHALVNYLEAYGGSPKTVRQVLAALCAVDAEWRAAQGETAPERLRQHPIVMRWLKSWSRDNPRRPKRQAPALERDELERILLTMQQRGWRASSLGHVQRYA